jgi:hypothetical protein
MESRTLYALGVLLLTAAIQFSVSLTGSRAAILLTGIALGLAPYGLWIMLEASAYARMNLYLLGAAAAAGIALGGLGHWALQTAEAGEREAAAISAISGGLAVSLGVLGSVVSITWLRGRGARACKICSRRLSREFHRCPRCAHEVCSREKCWNANALRCADCERLQRPLLALEDEVWWTERLGARLPRGRCRRCDSEAVRADLRECVDCTRAMCVRCWDMENGECGNGNCQWLIPDLPEGLEMLIARDRKRSGGR